MRRLVIILADGLRPDAVSPTLMPSLDALGDAYTLARRAQTVRPSATVAALASLATGVGPETHRLIEPGLRFLPRLGRIRPVAWELARAGIPADIVTADHGGGGVTANEHDEPHPVNDHIPLILAGPGVTRRHQLTRTISLLDVPATVLWWFGVPVPTCYEGRPLSEAFARVAGPAPQPSVA